MKGIDTRSDQSEARTRRGEQNWGQQSKTIQYPAPYHCHNNDHHIYTVSFSSFFLVLLFTSSIQTKQIHHCEKKSNSSAAVFHSLHWLIMSSLMFWMR